MCAPLWVQLDGVDAPEDLRERHGVSPWPYQTLYYLSEEKRVLLIKVADVIQDVLYYWQGFCDMSHQLLRTHP
jgi:hypothetical protein